ncbi:hypothetical protein FA95DRAFT_1557498 [Auriscalpium vulgare]|uniref:Uncharacterized protein n=1 Tax=Auriscalpium vulgare TaxID=40419 RepID=A0ACB8RYL3_9AGAM|nr:hypothetical protein FA95DRAFT_1557498 [Auriscalpium vulgare]
MASGSVTPTSLSRTLFSFLITSFCLRRSASSRSYFSRQPARATVKILLVGGNGKESGSGSLKVPGCPIVRVSMSACIQLPSFTSTAASLF